MNDIKRFHGMYRGVVKNNADPENQRRLQVSVPQVTGSETTDWVWPVEPSGLHTAVPVVGQGVWVSYIGGDPEHPIWHGSFGKNQGNNKTVYLQPLSNSVSLSGYTDVITVTSKSDGTQELDLTSSLIGIAKGVLRFVASPPAHKTSTGTKGDFAVGTVSGTTYVYFCIATNSWVRIGTDSSSW